MKKLVLSKEEKEVEQNYEKLQPVSLKTRKNIERIIEGSRKRNSKTYR